MNAPKKSNWTDEMFLLAIQVTAIVAAELGYLVMYTAHPYSVNSWRWRFCEGNMHFGYNVPPNRHIS
jgi:uncharacterized protein (DUF2062 family)